MGRDSLIMAAKKAGLIKDPSKSWLMSVYENNVQRGAFEANTYENDPANIELRKNVAELGLTRKQLAAGVNVTKSTVHNWFSGRSGITKPRQKKINRFFSKDETQIKKLSCSTSQAIRESKPV